MADHEPDPRPRIESEHARVTGLVHSVKRDLGDAEEFVSGEPGNHEQRGADGATETFEREKDLGLLDDLEAELAELEAALGRIDDGTYGIDEVTGEPIDPDRLGAFPAARTNVDTVAPDGS